MELWKEIISIVVSNGVFAVLFVWLFLYQLKDSAKREKNYQETIDKLTTSLNVLDEVKEEVSDIKEFLRCEEDEDEDPLLRFVLPPFVWSLRSTALAPESEDVLEAEDHKLEAALGSPLGALHPQSPCPQPPLSLHP